MNVRNTTTVEGITRPVLILAEVLGVFIRNALPVITGIRSKTFWTIYSNNELNIFIHFSTVSAK